MDIETKLFLIDKKLDALLEKIDPEYLQRLKEALK